MFCILSLALSNKNKGYSFTDSLISNIDCVEDGYKIIENELEYSLINNMLKAKVYSSKYNILRAIRNKSLTKMYIVKIILDQNNFKEDSKDLSSIVYYYYPLNQHAERYEIFGKDDDYKRFELGDDDFSLNILWLGQHIEFKYQDKILDGYISAIPDPKKSNCNAYEVIMRKGKSYDLLWGDDKIHYNDIIKFLDGSWDINELYHIILKYNHIFTYTDQYINELAKALEGSK